MNKTYTKSKSLKVGKIIPGTYDLVFKALMTSEREYLADIISGITGIKKEMIMKNAEIKSNEYPINNVNENKRTSDLIIEIKDNIINIEMNNFKNKKLNRRNNNYLCKLVSIIERDSTVIQINLDNFDNGNKEIAKYVLYNKEEGIEDEDSLIKYRVNLALIRKKYYNREEINKLERELLLLTIDDKHELEKLTIGDNVMKKVNKKINELSDDRYVCMMYDRDEFKEFERTEYLTEKITNEVTEKITNEVTKKVTNEVTEKVTNEVTEKVTNEVTERVTNEVTQKVEKTKSKEIAKNCINLGISIEDISKATGLSIDELEELK